MNLVIDFGNTRIKAAVFDHKVLLKEFNDSSKDFLQTVNTLKKQYPKLNNVLYSASGNTDQLIIDGIKSMYNVYQLTHNTEQIFTNFYQTPQSLGLDRIALLSAAIELYPNKNTLIIDAGTCITIDFLDSDGRYYGGNISPGLLMRLKAMHNQTAKLPQLNLIEPKTSPVGKNTNDAMLNGVINSVVFEIDEYIRRYRLDFPQLTVILTGGDEQYLSTKLKSSIFAVSNFQLFGLNAILQNTLND